MIMMEPYRLKRKRDERIVTPDHRKNDVGGLKITIVLDSVFIENTCSQYVNAAEPKEKTLTGLANRLTVSYMTLNRTERNQYDASGKEYQWKKHSWNRCFDSADFRVVIAAMEKIRNYRLQRRNGRWNHANNG